MINNSKSLVDVIKNNRKKRLAVSAVIEGGREGIAVISKLTTDKDSPVVKQELDQSKVNKAALESLYSKMAGIRTNNKNIVSLFPDVELAIQIWVSSILSPKKMTDIQLNYRLNKKFSLDPSISIGILDLIKEYVNEHYELEESLPGIVREALFMSGSCPYAVISEAALDEVINSDLIATYSNEEYRSVVDRTLETITRPINIIRGKKRKDKLPNNTDSEKLINKLLDDKMLSIHDNPNVMRFNDIKESISKAFYRKDMRETGVLSAESADSIEYLDIFRNKGRGQDKQLERVNIEGETYRKSVGKPLVIKLPSGSVIPAITPGNEEDHMGYFVLLDDNFRPISNSSFDAELSKLANSMSTKSGGNTTIQKAYDNLVNSTTNERVDINSLFELYKDMLEHQLFNTVKATLNGKSVSLAERNDIYFTMFSRALQNQRTSILYLRKESVVYYAFQYNEFGIGKSLLDNMAVQASMRAILLFARVMNEAKNSIDVTNVNIEFDPEDPDPEKTIETIQSGLLRLNQNAFPLGINNPIDLISWVQRSGFRFTYTGHPGLPNTNVTFDSGGVQHVIPSSDLEDELRKQSIIALGLPPETVDNGFSPDFARTVVNNNILLSKRVGVYQKSLNLDVTKNVSLLISNDMDLRNLIKDEIRGKVDQLDDVLNEAEKALRAQDSEKFLEYFVDLIADRLYVELPRPEETDINNLAIEYDLYKEKLDGILDSIISTEIFGEDVIGDIANNIDSIRNMYKHHLLRKWMSDNNYYPEALEITSTDKEEVRVLLESMKNHLAHTARNTVSMFDIMTDIKKALDADTKNVFEGDQPEGNEASVSESSSSSDYPEEEKESEQSEEDDPLVGLEPDDLDL